MGVLPAVGQHVRGSRERSWSLSRPWKAEGWLEKSWGHSEGIVTVFKAISKRHTPPAITRCLCVWAHECVWANEQEWDSVTTLPVGLYVSLRQRSSHFILVSTDKAEGLLSKWTTRRSSILVVAYTRLKHQLFPWDVKACRSSRACWKCLCCQARHKWPRAFRQLCHSRGDILGSFWSRDAVHGVSDLEAA